MQYLISVVDDTTNSADADEMAAIDAFNDQLVADGHWVFAGGLTAPGAATIIDNRTGTPLVTDGPFIESKEYVAGFWILDVPDHATALRLATEGSRACNRRVEVRPFLGG